MKNLGILENDNLATASKARLARRSFLTQAGLLTLGAAATNLTYNSARAEEQESAAVRQQEAAQAKDTVKQILTAALIAEGLATTFYYNVLVGAVIQDPQLSGPGGSATNVTAAGNFGNVDYIRAALTEEISHANLLRGLLGLHGPANDPYQTFYFPAGTFDTLAAFTGLLDALENAFIGAYLNAIQEFSALGALAKLREQRREYRNEEGGDSAATYTAEQLDYYAKVAGSIMGVEAEHRVLGRVISNSNPANNVLYEQLDGLNAVYNGPKSAVAALTPFLTPSTGPAYSYAYALANQASVSTPVTGGPPTY